MKKFILVVTFAAVLEARNTVYLAFIPIVWPKIQMQLEEKQGTTFALFVTLRVSVLLHQL